MLKTHAQWRNSAMRALERHAMHQATRKRPHVDGRDKPGHDEWT